MTSTASEIETVGTLTAHPALESFAPRTIECGGSPSEPHPAPGRIIAPLMSAHRRTPDLVSLAPLYGNKKKGCAVERDMITTPNESR
jgi:hypothetical protein